MRRCFEIFIPLPFLLSVYLPFSTSTPTNFTIDDASGDLRTGQMVDYQPSNLWGTQACSGCAILPGTSRILDGTYHEATWNPGKPQLSMTINFNGTAIYMFFTLIDNVTLFSPGITILTAVNFTLDDAPPRLFEYIPQNKQDYLFQFPVYAQDGLEGGNHKLVMSGPSDNITSIYVNFDYATYTHDEDIEVPSTGTTQIPPQKVSTTPASGSSPTVTATPLATSGTGTSPSPTALNSGPTSNSHTKIIIIVSAIAGVVLLAIAAAILLYFLRRWKREDDTIRTMSQRPHNITGQTQQLPPPAAMSYATTVVPFNHHNQQDSLEDRLMRLERRIQRMKTTRGSERPSRQSRTENGTTSTSNDTSDRAMQNCQTWSEEQRDYFGSESGFTEAPPEYRRHDVSYTSTHDLEWQS